MGVHAHDKGVDGSGKEEENAVGKTQKFSLQSFVVSLSHLGLVMDFLEVATGLFTISLG